MGERPFGLNRSPDPGGAATLPDTPTPVRSMLSWPWSYYADLERIGKGLGIGPDELDRMHLWRLAARLGFDLVETDTGLPAESAGQRRASVRAAQTRRAQELANVAPDVATLRARRVAERAEARKDRATRKANRVSADPEGAVTRNDRLLADPETVIVTHG